MSAKAPNSSSQRNRGTQLLLLALVAALVFVVADFYLLNRNNQYDREYIAHATDIQVLSQQLATAASGAASGNLDAFDSLEQARDNIFLRVNQLISGDPETGLPESPSLPVPADQDLDPLTAVQVTSDRVIASADEIIGSQSLVLNLADAADEFAAVVPQMQAKTDEAIRALVQARAPNQQVFVTSRQLVLADRMLRRVSDILQGGATAVSAADSFGRESALFETVLESLISGDEDRNIEAVRAPAALSALGEVTQLFDGNKQNIDAILAASTNLFAVRSAADEILFDATDLFEESGVLATAYGGLSDTRAFPSMTAGIIGTVTTLVLLLLVGWTLLTGERRRVQSTQDQNQRNQDAILRLLDEMSALADGDLTVQATVTEDVTGAIADSVNFAVESMRDLVVDINDTAQKVAASAQETRATTTQLAESSEFQANQVRSATDTINAMAHSFDDMANRSTESAEVAQRSVEIANNGAQMVRQTITGMDTIRDQIQETSKRIKRLGESSQEIGDIVELINGIAEQTNILALNAAIQAASAGGAGRGFAVVADEVQRLAERATNATRRIETLVQTIQTDTSEAVVSMETTTAEVVRGAKLAEDAGEALERIETVSNDLSALIQDIAKEAQNQSGTATDVAGMMNDIRDISMQASEGTDRTAQAVGKLADLVRDLRDSVADFKLPE